MWKAPAGVSVVGILAGMLFLSPPFPTAQSQPVEPPKEVKDTPETKGVLARLKDLEDRLRASEKELDQVKDDLAKTKAKADALDKGGWKYTSFYRVIGTQGIKGSDLDVPQLDRNVTFTVAQQGRVLAVWCECSDSPGEATKFYHIKAVAGGRNVVLNVHAVPGYPACRVGVRVHVLYQQNP